jgi:hypothetical protein
MVPHGDSFGAWKPLNLRHLLCLKAPQGLAGRRRRALCRACHRVCGRITAHASQKVL